MSSVRTIAVPTMYMAKGALLTRAAAEALWLVIAKGATQVTRSATTATLASIGGLPRRTRKSRRSTAYVRAPTKNAVGSHTSASPVRRRTAVSVATHAKTAMRYRAMSRSTASRASRSVCSISRLPWLGADIGAVYAESSVRSAAFAAAQPPAPRPRGRARRDDGS